MIGINRLSCIPLRSHPSDKAEMVNQLLYGETFDILEQEEKWSKIRLHHDQYEGWADNKQFEIYTKHEASKKNIVGEKFLYANKITYPMGSFVEFETIKHPFTLTETAKQFLETPYLWGGRTFMGIDCSGFTQIVFRSHSITLNRDAYQQEQQGQAIEFENCETNDLAFFANENNKVTHVGIIIKENENVSIIHASGKVRIDTLDRDGILKNAPDNYSHQLHTIKRIEHDKNS